MPEFIIQNIKDNDRDWIREYTIQKWHSEFCFPHGEKYYPDKLPEFIAIKDNKKAGLLTYNINKDECEIVTLNSDFPSLGIGNALIEAAKNVALEKKCRRIWLTTTNDNLNGLRFYQKRGFKLVKIYRNTIEYARKLKPIPLIGDNGIPLRDEIELEIIL